LVIALTHMGLAQQLNLANQPFVGGVDYVFGADTHERIRQPLKGKYSQVTEPGSFASFIARLDIIVEDGKIKDEAYELMEVTLRSTKQTKRWCNCWKKRMSPITKK